ncbi:hypothetical protein [Flavobacterium sp.]|uniref:hypothetical protein n=1 Tax=Flavobacterium sp. TaxID=239 RepID=UPI003D6A9E63
MESLNKWIKEHEAGNCNCGDSTTCLAGQYLNGTIQKSEFEDGTGICRTSPPWFQTVTQYHNYKGGVNNLQTVTVKNMNGATLSVFSSQKHRAMEYANRFIKKESLTNLKRQTTWI